MLGAEKLDGSTGGNSCSTGGLSGIGGNGLGMQELMLKIPS